MAVRRIEGWTYTIGVAVLGAAYYPLDRITGGGLVFVGAALAYLVLLRLLGSWLAKRWSR